MKSVDYNPGKEKVNNQFSLPCSKENVILLYFDQFPIRMTYKILKKTF